MDTKINTIDMFFTPPTALDPAAGRIRYSTLYLLRRDVDFCFGIDHVTRQRRPGAGAALFPGTMAIMAGIDLLAKCQHGTEEVGKTGFKEFLIKYFGLNPALAKEHAEAIYQLRNGLLHAFGLSSRDRSRLEYQFVLTEDQPDLIRVVHFSAVVWHVLIDLRVLRQRFEEAIELYRNDVRKDPNLQKKFIRVFKRYGIVMVGRPRQPWFGPLTVP